MRIQYGSSDIIKKIRYLFLLVLLMMSQPVFALRCNSYVIHEGMYKAEVYSKCGAAIHIDTHIETRGFNNTIQNQQYYGSPRKNYPNSSFGYGQDNYQQIDIVIEEWIYNFGASKLQQYLRFENGKLMEIRNLERGY